MEIDQYAATVAHEICNAECFAFTGEGPKPHSARCQATAELLVAAFRKFGDPMQAKIERLLAALAECAKATDFDDWDLEFRPTKEALIARAALAHG